MARIAIIENSEGLGGYFTRYMDRDEYEIFPVWKTSELPGREHHSYLFTGDYNNISDGLLPLHRKEMEFVRTLGDRKIFGSCFFHQLLGVIFGGRVEKRERRYLGWHRVTIERDHPILEGLDVPYYLNLNVDELVKVPETATILATGQGCRYQALQYGELIVSCQSHPEIFRQDGLEAIRKHREALLDRCPELDTMVEETKGFADDGACEVFLMNMTRWLRS